MKKLRYNYLGIVISFMVGVVGINFQVFAESEISTEATETVTEESNSKETPEVSPDTLENVLKIKSYNPGYTNEGEFVELLKLSENDISLAGLTVIYITSSGNEYVVYEFPKESEMVGESLLMRLASSDEVQNAENYHDVADVTYTRNMSQSKGKINLVYNDKVVDTLCWGLGGDNCFSAFNSKKPTTLVRDLSAEEYEDLFVHTANYTPNYNPESPGLRITEVPEEKIEPKCRTIEFSEILTYFENSNAEQFIELFNRSDEKVELSKCFLRYKNKNYSLSGEVGANGFKVFYNVSEWGLSLTKNPASSNFLEIVDADGEIIDKLIYYSGQKKGVSFAMIGYKSDGAENWVQTYNVTPGAENSYQQFKTCPVDKVLNLETGNCVNATSLKSTLAACPEGKYRNPLTGRCKSYATTASTELKPCAEGYERNPETGRCRKIVKNDGADYKLEPEVFEEKSDFVAIWAIVAVIGVGLLYILFQYRKEIVGLFTKNNNGKKIDRVLRDKSKTDKQKK